MNKEQAIEFLKSKDVQRCSKKQTKKIIRKDLGLITYFKLLRTKKLYDIDESFYASCIFYSLSIRIIKELCKKNNVEWAKIIINKMNESRNYIKKLESIKYFKSINNIQHNITKDKFEIYENIFTYWLELAYIKMKDK